MSKQANLTEAGRTNFFLFDRFEYEGKPVRYRATLYKVLKTEQDVKDAVADVWTLFQKTATPNERIANDGIGSYECHGVKGVDTGTDYVEVDGNNEGHFNVSLSVHKCPHALFEFFTKTLANTCFSWHESRVYSDLPYTLTVGTSGNCDFELVDGKVTYLDAELEIYYHEKA